MRRSRECYSMLVTTLWSRRRSGPPLRTAVEGQCVACEPAQNPRSPHGGACSKIGNPNADAERILPHFTPPALNPMSFGLAICCPYRRLASC